MKLVLMGVLGMGIVLSASAAERGRSIITLEEVGAWSHRPPEEGGKVAIEWMERGRFPTNFEWQAAMLFMRKLPDTVPRSTLSNVLTQIAGDYDENLLVPWKAYPRYALHCPGARPIESLLTVAQVRLKNDSIVNAINELVAICDTNRVGVGQGVVNGFLQTEVVSTMLAHGCEVPVRFRSSPEYVRHEILGQATNMTTKDLMEIGSSAIWVPKRSTEEFKDIPDNKRRDAENESNRRWCRATFASVAWQSVLLQESKRLVGEGRRFIEGRGNVVGGKEGMGLAVQMVWAYVIVARHSSQEEGKTLLAKVEHVVGKERAGEILKKYDGALESSADAWWYKKCVYSSERDPAFWGIYTYVCYEPKSTEATTGRP